LNADDKLNGLLFKQINYTIHGQISMESVCGFLHKTITLSCHNTSIITYYMLIVQTLYKLYFSK
jgi:hypothetical protein